MGALVGLGAGLGILLIIGHLFQGRAVHRSRPRRNGRLQALVHAAAIPRLTLQDSSVPVRVQPL